MHFYMTVAGTKTTNVEGSVTQKGREKSSLCTWFELGVETPVDDLTGYAAGKRRHQPVKIRKEIDKASPLLYNMAVNNELAKTVTLKFWKVGTAAIGATGAETQYYTVTLTNAQIRRRQAVHPGSLGSRAGPDPLDLRVRADRVHLPEDRARLDPGWYLGDG